MFLALKEKVAACVAKAAGVPIHEAEMSIELPKGEFGDVATSICFALAKKEKKNPAEIASEVAKKVKLPSWISRAEAKGPYVNFFLSDAFYSSLLKEASEKSDKFGMGKPSKGKIIVEFPSVNPNKPWHIGHLRNALLGDCVCSVLEFSGKKVERMDYIDDLGLQVAQSFWGYENFGKAKGKKLDLELGKQYVEVSKKFESDSAVQEKVRKLLKKMEQGKSKEAKDCRKLVEKCVAAQYETAFKFGIFHDVLVFESDIMRTIFDDGIKVLKKSRAIEREAEGKNKGCWVAKMKSTEFADMENPDKVLIRGDGTATYTGKDVIFQLWKFGILKNQFKYSKFLLQPNKKECFMTSCKGKKGNYGKASEVVNVIGTEQIYPQKVIKEILLSMDYKKEAQNSVHLSYEHVGLADEKFSGRQGTWIGYTADELYSEGLKRADEKIKKEIKGKDREKIGAAIASSAIRFAFIKTSPEKRITFKWDEALSLEGDSAPYAIYAHARAHKIFEKGGKGKAGLTGLGKEEKELLKKIMLLDFAINEAAKHLRPHIIADYCIELACLYNKFYNACPVISSKNRKVKEMRLAINFAALTAMKNALSAIGISALERM